MRTNFTLNDNYIKMVRGTSLSFGFEVVDENGAPFTQELEHVYFACKKKDSDEYAFRTSLVDGIDKVDVGKYRVRVAPEDTQNIEIGKYFYDLQIGLNGDVFALMRGVLEIEHEVNKGV